MAAVPPDLALKPHNSVFPLMSLASLTLRLLPWRPDECLQVSEFVCGPFKNVSGFPATVHLTRLDRVLTDFHNQMLWEPLSTEHWAGETGVGLGPLSQGWGTSTTEVSLLAFNHYLWGWGSACFASLHLLPVSMCPLFIPLVIGVLFS